MPNVPKFDTYDIEGWIQLYEVAAYNNCWSDDEKYRKLYSAFQDTPYLEYYNNLIQSRQIYNWTSAKAEFLLRNPEPSNLICSESILNRKQMPNERVVDYFFTKDASIRKMRTVVPEPLIVQHLFKGLHPDIRRELMRNSIGSSVVRVNELIKIARSIEECLPILYEEHLPDTRTRSKKRVEFEEDRRSPR